MGGYAWVTLATNNSYSLGALVLAHSLKKANTTHKMVVLITPAVSEPMREQLQTVFDLVKVVDVLDSKDEAHLALMKRPDLGITFTKIHCWRLVEFEKCVFLDADTLVVRNCDELFEREEFSAAPDVSWPDCFNSGVFVYRPSIDTFNKLLQYAVENRSFDGGDQGLLNQFFSGWATEDIKKHLPFVYNLTSIAAYSYIPAFKHYQSETRIVHFIGEGKPWLQQLDVSTRTVIPTTGSEHLAPLLQQWWDVFCEKVHPNLNKSLESNNDGMLQPPVDACSNSVAIALTDEPQTARLTEPCTPYREKDDFRQSNLPYQPFDVKGSSGELLNVEFLLVSTPEQGDDPLEGDKKEESFESREKDRSEPLEGDEGGRKEQGEGGGNEPVLTRVNEEEPLREEGNNTDEEKKVEEEDQNQQEEPPPVKEEKDCNSFFPDENYVHNYLEQNVMMYQPFENRHEPVNCEREPEQDVPTLQRFLTIPEDDQRQIGNTAPNVEEECNPPNPLPPEDNPPPREPTPPKEQPVTEKRELTKSKSMSYIPSNCKATEASPPRSIWKSQPDLNVDPNRRYSMPKLKPILPKQNSFSKSVPSVMPKVTLYTEILMSSEYKDPIDLPKDKIGFVESHIHKEAKLRRCKSDADIRSKFGPLPYAFFPEVQKPVVPKKFPPRHLDNEVYDLSKCKRQMGNKPKPKNADEMRENVRMLPALKPIVPAKDKKSTLIKKRKSKELSPGVGGREKILKREPKIARERRRESKITPRNVSTSANGETLDQILQKLREFSKDYQHFFGVTWGSKKKTVKCKNAEVQAGEDDRGECKASEAFETVSSSVSTRSKETQTGKEAKQDGAEFRQFRNYVKDKRETSQKGLLSIQDILSQFDQPRTEPDGSSKLNNRVVRAEMTAGQRDDDAAPAQEYSKCQTTAEDGGSDNNMVNAAANEEVESINIPDVEHNSTSQSRSPAAIKEDEKTFPESHSKPEIARTRLQGDSETVETSKELDPAATKSEEERPNSSDVIKTPENDDKSNDNPDSGQLPCPEPQNSNENDEKTEPEASKACLESETSETSKELDSAGSKIEEVHPDSGSVIKTPENGEKSNSSLHSDQMPCPEIQSSKENDDGIKPEASRACLAAETPETSEELVSAGSKIEEVHPDSGSVIKTPENGEKSNSSLHSDQMPCPEIQSSKENDDGIKPEASRACLAAETPETSEELVSAGKKSEEEHPESSEVVKTPKNDEKSNNRPDCGQSPCPELQNSDENDEKTKPEASKASLESETVKMSEELDSAATKSEEEHPESSDVMKTSQNDDKSSDNLDSVKLSCPEIKSSKENGVDTKPEASRACVELETPETSKELDSEVEKSEDVRPNMADSSCAFQTPENGKKSNDGLDPCESPSLELSNSKENGEEHSRKNGCDHAALSEKKERNTENSTTTAVQTPTEPQPVKNGVSSEDAAPESAPVLSSHVIIQPEQKRLPKRRTEKPLQRKTKNWTNWVERPKNPNEILCVPDFETPRSSRVTLPTPPAAADRPETVVAAENRKSTVPDGNGQANGLDSPEAAVRIVGKKRSGRKSSPASPIPSTPPQNGGLQDLNGGPGIAGAIAQLSLDAGAQTAGSAEASAAQQEYLRRQNWETGNMDYMGRDSFDNIWSKICQTLEAKEREEAAGGSPEQATAGEKKPEAIPPTEDPVTLATILQKCPEFIETLPGDPAAGPVEDDEIIFSKPENRQSCLANIKEDEEGRTESAEATGKVKLSDILQPGSGVGSKCENVPDKKVGGTAEVKAEKVQPPVMPATQITPPTPTPEQVQPPAMPTVEKTPASPKVEQAPPTVTPTGDKVQPPATPEGSKAQPTSTPVAEQVQPPTTQATAQVQPPSTPSAAQVQPPTTPPTAQVQPPTTPPTAQVQPPTTPPTAQVQPPTTPPTAQVQPPSTPPAAQVQPPSTPPAAQVQPQPTPPTAQVQPPSTPPAAQVQPQPTPPTAQVQPPSTPPAAQVQPPTAPPTAQVQPPTTPPTAQVQPPSAPPAAQVQPPTAPPTAQVQPPTTPTSAQVQPPTTPTSAQVQPPTTPTSAQVQPPITQATAQVSLPATPVADKVEVPKAPAGEKAQPEVLPAEGKPTGLPQSEKPECKTVAIPPSSPTTQLPTPEGQSTAEKKAAECTTVAIPSPPIAFPGAPFEGKGKPAAKGKKAEDKPEVQSEPIPLPPPESPTLAPTQEPTAKVSDSAKEEGKQKKGVFTKILEMVGVAPKEKNDIEPPKSVFYDVQGGAEEAKEVEQASEVKEKPEEEVKTSDQEEKTTEPQKTEELPPPKAEEAVKKEEKPQQRGKKEKGKPGQGSMPKPARGPQDGKKPSQASPTPKSPSPKLTMPQTPPETAVTTPTPPPQTDVPPRKNSGLLKVDETILETPPVTDAPKEGVAEAIKGKVDDIIGKAKSEVESLLQDRRSAEKEVGESTDLINTMKLMMGAEEPGKAEEVEELKVTSEEDRKRHKGEAVSSKLSDQILKAIPPPRRKAISEASASTSSIPKATPAPEQQKPAPEQQKPAHEQQKPAPGESKSKPSKPSSIPVPPPRSRGKPSPPKGKGKK